MTETPLPRTDIQQAAIFKAKIRDVIETQLLPILQECNAAGLVASFGIGPNPAGQPSLQSIQIVKHF